MTCTVTTGTLTVGGTSSSSLNLTGPEALSLNASCEAAGTYLVSTTGVSGLITWSSATGVISGTGTSRTATFATAGSHTVAVTATGDDGVAMSDTIDVVVAQGACDQSASSVSIEGPTALSLGVDCTVSASYTAVMNKATNELWSINSATATISAAGEATFTEAGSYSIGVSAAGESGAVSDAITLSVAQGDCVANAFTATLATSDVLAGQETHISWMGEKVVSVVATSSDDVVITQTEGGFSVTSAVEGDYTITVTATHNDGSKSTVNLALTVYRPEQLSEATLIIYKRVPVGESNGDS